MRRFCFGELAEPLGDIGLLGTTFWNARSNSSSVASAPISSARSMNRRDCSPSGFGFLGINRLAIRESLADDTTDQPVGAFFVVNAERYAIAVPEIKFGQITMQVRFA